MEADKGIITLNIVVSFCILCVSYTPCQLSAWAWELTRLETFRVCITFTMIMMCIVLGLLSSLVPVQSGTVPLGVSCSASNNHLDPSTHKFITECSGTTFCSANEGGTCIPKLCRRDEFPFEYASSSGDTLPPMCEKGTFCPDEGSGCKVLAGVGEPCQLNRDEQCAPPPNWKDLGSTQNFNGSICLYSTCMQVS
jgi:hypothetical protein